MRDIARMAAQLSGLDERYRPFSNELLSLADRFQSQAVLSFVEAHMDEAV
jgi:hypothetical protein